MRGQLQDALVHRVLDYSIALKQAREKIQQLSNPWAGPVGRQMSNPWAALMARQLSIRRRQV